MPNDEPGPADDPVLAALVAYGLAVLPMLSGGPLVIPGESWIRQGDHFLQVDSPRFHWLHKETGLSEPPFVAPTEREQAVEAIRRDASLTEVVGHLVGWAGGSTSVTESSLLLSPLEGALEEGNGNPDQEAITRHYSLALRDLRSRVLQIHTVVPISGLHGSVDSIELGAGARIRKLSDEEIVRCISVGMIRSRFGPSSLVSAPTHGVVISETVTVLIGVDDDAGEAAAGQLLEASKMYDRTTHLVERVVSALRLHGPGQLVVLGRLQFSDYWAQRGWTQFRSNTQSHVPSGTYELTAADTEPLISLFGALQSAPVHKAKNLHVALRRFSFAAERELPEDALIDLMVAAESLYLADTDPDFRGELRLRLSLRAAAFEELPDSRLRTFAIMKGAYVARSKIVHGSGSPLSAEDEAALRQGVHEVLRAALTKAVRLLANGQPKDKLFAPFEELLTWHAPPGIDPAQAPPSV